MTPLPTHIYVGPIELVRSSNSHWSRSNRDCERVALLKSCEVEILLGNDNTWHGLVLTPHETSRYSSEDLELVVAKLTHHVPKAADLQVERNRIAVLLEGLDGSA